MIHRGGTSFKTEDGMAFEESVNAVDFSENNHVQWVHDGDNSSPGQSSLYFGSGNNDDIFSSDKLNQFRVQLHQLSKQKDVLMPKADGAFPDDWLGLAWDYQSLAEHVIRFIWPCPYPDGLLPCISHQLEYLKSRLQEFPNISDVEKDKFRRLYVLAALGIIAKLKLITFCWTFVELKCNERRNVMRQMSYQEPRLSFNKSRRIGAHQSFDTSCQPDISSDAERTEYTTRSGRKTHRTSMKAEKI